MYLLLILFFMVLLAIAFFTLMERKILGYKQLRCGPNKVFIKGVMQPLFDGLKLFMKENNYNFNINLLFFIIFPFFSLVIMLMLWQSYSFIMMDFLCNSYLFFILFSSMSVYTILGSGWFSNSKYAMLGCYRSVAQVISYEVSLVFLIITVIFFSKSYSFSVNTEKCFISHLLFYGFILVTFMWFIIILAELNRSPFDFAESESELVSGFNIEFGGLKFAFLFLSEYGSMIFMSYLTSLMFLSTFFFNCLLFMFLMVWVRGVVPRYRYDNLMNLNWKLFLPVILIILMIVCLYFYSIV